MSPSTAADRLSSRSISSWLEVLVKAVDPFGQWLLIGSGVGLMFASEFVFFAIGSSDHLVRVLELALPMAIGVGLVWYGFELRDHEFSSWQIAVLGLAVLLGMGLFVVLASYFQLLLSLEQSPPAEPIYLLLNAGAIGAFINLVYAYEYVRISARADRLRERVDRLTSIISQASHDVRNPLNVAQGYADLLREEVSNQDNLGSLTDALDRIETLIDELVVYAHTNRSDSAREEVSLESVARDSWGMVDTKEGSLRVESDRSLRADPDRLLHLFENLFRNAVVHAGPAVTVTVGDLPDGFFVADDGEGIPEKDREEIFDPGYTTSENGTGLGLNIVREICQRQGWSVSVVDSESDGTRFEIRLSSD